MNFLQKDSAPTASNEAVGDSFHSYYLRILAYLWNQENSEGNAGLTDAKQDENDESDEDDLVFMSDQDKLDRWQRKMSKYCLGRFYKQFESKFHHPITIDIDMIQIREIQEFERNIITAKAKLKHKKFEQFIRKYTNLKNYESVFAIANNNKNNNNKQAFGKNNKNNRDNNTSASLKQKLEEEKKMNERVERLASQSNDRETAEKWMARMVNPVKFKQERKGTWYVIYDRGQYQNEKYCVEYSDDNQYLLDIAFGKDFYSKYVGLSSNKRKNLRLPSRELTIFAYMHMQLGEIVGKWPYNINFNGLRNKDLIGRRVQVIFDRKILDTNLMDNNSGNNNNNNNKSNLTVYGWQIDDKDRQSRQRRVVYTKAVYSNQLRRNGVCYGNCFYPIVEALDETIESPPVSVASVASTYVSQPGA